jgi:hypothetical protein
MNPASLEALGLSVKDLGGTLEAELELITGQAVNPLTRQFISSAQFMVVGDRLIAIGPAELVGIAPIHLSHVSKSTALEDILVKSLNEAIMHLQNRSAQLSALGLSPKVDSQTLELSSDLEAPPWSFSIVSDRQGHFRVGRVAKAGAEVKLASSHGFELSEFRERKALESYLIALVSDRKAESPGQGSSSAQVAPPTELPISVHELMVAFSSNASIPERTQIEVLMELKVKDQHYRFAAARVAGRTFRGLIAGAHGKLWADRFDLTEFNGVPQLLAEVLKVPVDQIEVL